MIISFVPAKAETNYFQASEFAIACTDDYGSADSSSGPLPSIKAYKRCPDNHHPHMIDLGLPSGTLWACCNVGANCPEQSGGYYAWGETETKQWYDWSLYKYSKSENENEYLGDNIASTKYDVAHVLWGAPWQMPTREQMQELIDNCKSAWTKRNTDIMLAMEKSGPGYNYGVQMMGKNGGLLFLPAAGSIIESGNELRGLGGAYWTSSSEKGNGNDVFYYMFNANPDWVSDNTVPYWGQNVRPVCKPESTSFSAASTSALLPLVSCPDDHHPHMVDLGLPSGTKWSCCNVGANTPVEYGGYYAWGETEEKNEYEWNNYKYLNKSKKCIFIGKDIAGTKYDAAHIQWGDSWQMPSKEQYMELSDNCSFEWIVKDWVVGMLIVGKNGNSIFLPAAGSFAEGSFDGESFAGYYWTSTNSANGVDYAVPFQFSKIMIGNGVIDSYFRRIHGYNIRPISH